MLSTSLACSRAGKGFGGGNAFPLNWTTGRSSYPLLRGYRPATPRAAAAIVRARRTTREWEGGVQRNDRAASISRDDEHCGAGEGLPRSRRGGGWNWVVVVSGLLNPNDSGVSALERRPRHDKGYHEGGGCRRRGFAFRQLVRRDRGRGARSRARVYRDDAGGGTLRRVVASALRPAQVRRRRSGAVGRGRAPRASRTDADGHVRQDADRRAARASGRRGRQDARMAERFASRLSAAHPGRRRLDRRGLSLREPTPAGCGAR